MGLCYTVNLKKPIFLLNILRNLDVDDIILASEFLEGATYFLAVGCAASISEDVSVSSEICSIN